MRSLFFVMVLYLTSTIVQATVYIQVRDLKTKEFRNYLTTTEFKIPANSNHHSCSLMKSAESKNSWYVDCSVYDKHSKLYSSSPRIALDCDYNNDVVSYMSSDSLEKGVDLVWEIPKYYVIVACKPIN